MATLSTYITQGKWEYRLKRVITLGLFCLIAGMTALPTSGHIYDRVVIVLFALPTLLMIARQPGSVQRLWQQPAAKWVILLLVWSMLSLLWSDGGVSNWIGRCLGIFLFLYAWIQVFEGREKQIHWFLIACSSIMALAALTLIILFETTAFHSVLSFKNNRLMGIGVISHPNIASAVMSAAIIWLCTYRCSRLWQHIARVLMITIFLVFITMAVSRSAWGGLFLALTVLAACHGGRATRWMLASLMVLGAVFAVVFMPELLARGWSARPGILEHSWALFVQHPWLGIGQGTQVHLYLPTFIASHAHNMFSQLAVQLGLPALLVWIGIWLYVGWQGWLHRHEPLGRLVLASWVYTTFAAQFDLPYLIGSPNANWLVAWLPLAICFSIRIKSKGHLTPK